VQAKLEAGDDAEIAAATTHGPEEIAVLVGVGRLHLARRSDDLDRHEVIHGKAPFAAQIAHAAAQGEPGNAGIGYVARRSDQAKDLRFAIDVAEPCTALDVDGHRLAVHADRAHLAQIDDEPTVADGAAADIVAAAAHADEEAVGPGKPHRRDDVGQTARLDNKAGSPVDQAVPHPARLIIGGVARRDDGPAERRFEGRKGFI